MLLLDIQEKHTLHFSLNVDDNTSIVLKMDESAILASEEFPLPDDDGRVHLFSQLGLSLFDCGSNNIANTGSRQSVQSPFESLHTDHIQILGTSVVSAIDYGTDGQTNCHTEFSSGGSSTS